MITHTMEDYLKEIYKLQQEIPKVTTQSIAARLHVQSPSVTNMVKRLADLNMLEHRPYQGVVLTLTGQKAALEVIRHHRLLELYLAEALGYSWDEVHDEAERLEHSISEDFEARIDQVLGYPKLDPHGEPIPSSEGIIASPDDVLLVELQQDSKAIIERVSDDDPEKLRYLGDLGLFPAVEIRILEFYPFDGPVRVLVNENEHILGRELAETIHVRPMTRIH